MGGVRRQFSESLIERSLGRFGGWQMVPGRAPQAHMEIRGSTGALVSGVRGAPLGAVEADVLTWLLAQWVRGGALPDGAVRTTIYQLTAALYGGRATGSDDRNAAAEALANLHLASVTVSDYDKTTGSEHHDRWVDVHLVKRIHYGQALRALRDRQAVSPTVLGALRGETLVVYIDDWLIERLQRDSVRSWLDWPVQRHLGAMAKRLWLYLEPHPGFRPLPGRPDLEGALLELDAQLYAELGAHCKQRRDNRKALRRGLQRIKQIDARYVMLDFAAGSGQGPDRLRVFRLTREALGTRVRLREDHAAPAPADGSLAAV